MSHRAWLMLLIGLVAGSLVTATALQAVAPSGLARLCPIPALSPDGAAGSRLPAAFVR